MRGPVRPFLLFGTVALVAVLPCAAQRVELTPFFGAYLPTATFATFAGGPFCSPGGCVHLVGASAQQENAILEGVRATAWVGPQVAVEVGVGYAASGISTRGSSETFGPGNGFPFSSSGAGSVTTGTAQVLVALTPLATGHLSWFVAAGGGFITHDSALSQPARTDWGPALGIGVRVPLTPTVTSRAEVQLVNFGGEGTDYSVTLGLSAALGEGPSGVREAVSGVVTLLQVEDLMQTVYLLQNGGRENNPLLGSYPSVGHLLWYDGLWTVSYWVMPKRIRLTYDVLAAAIEAEAVWHNAQQHVKGPAVGFKVEL